jgi:hypothetical protein
MNRQTGGEVHIDEWVHGWIDEYKKDDGWTDGS